MGFKVIAFLSVFSLVVGTSVAIKCYACAGSGSSDCALGKVSSMVIQPCNLTELATKYGLDEDDQNTTRNATDAKLQAACFQLFETQSYKPKMFARGCGIVPVGQDPCTYVSKYIHVTGCKSCKKNLCNKRRQRTHQNQTHPVETNSVY